MARRGNLICTHKLHPLTICFLFLLISSPSQLIEGRATISRSVRHFHEEEAISTVHIGSMPPRCDGKCRSCGHCEAIQVPINPKTKMRGKKSSSMPRINYASGDDDNSSNYKPMSWKCKCGRFIFNP